MTPEVAIRTLLLADGTVAAGLSDRVYSGYAPQAAARPFAILRRDTTDVDHHMGGASGLRQVRVEFYLYGEDYTVLNALAERCEAVLDSVNDRTTVDTIDIARLWIEDHGDEEIQIGDGKGRPIRVIRQLYGMHYHGN